MATTNQYNRQMPRVALVDMGIEHIGTGNGFTIKLPQGAYLTDIDLNTITAFDSGSATTGTVSDGTTTFVSAVDVQSTGNETASNLPKFYPEGGTLTFSLAETGVAAEAGRAIGYVQYSVLGAGESIYG